MMIMIDFNNFLNELGFELNENKLHKFLENTGLKNNIMKSDTIKGAFSKLSDDDKQSVVDSLNQTQKFFDGLFGTKSKEWTISDLDGAYVDIQTSGDKKKDECSCEKKECTCGQHCCAKTEDDRNAAGSVATSLRAEIEKQKQVELDELVNAVANKTVEKFSDQKSHQYVVEENANDVPTAYTYIKLLKNNAHTLSCNKEFISKLTKQIVELTGAKSAAVSYTDKKEPDGNYLKIVITL